MQSEGTLLGRIVSDHCLYIWGSQIRIIVPCDTIIEIIFGSLLLTLCFSILFVLNEVSKELEKGQVFVHVCV